MGSTTVQAPPPINPAQVGRESLQTQIELAPQQFAAEAQFAPQYAGLYQNIMRDALLGTNGQPGLLQTYSQAAPGISDLQAQLNRAQRQADITDVQQLGAQATQAFQQANPQLMQLQQAATQRAINPQDYVSQLGAAPAITSQDITAPTIRAGQLGFAPTIGAMMIGPGQRVSAGQNPLLGLMGVQAAEGLLSGGQLSPYESSQIANQVASQYNLQGRAGDPIAAATAALNLDAAQRARMQAAQQYAGNVSNAFTQQQGLGLTAQQANQQAQQQAALANQSAALQAAQATGQLGYQYGAANLNAEQQAALANQQAIQQAALANQQSNLQAQQLQGQFGLQYGAANQQAQYQNALLNQQALQQAAGIASSTAQDPYALILGRSGGFGQLAGLGGQAGSFGTGTQNFNPFNQGIMSIYGANQANQTAANVATANANAGLGAGALGALGSAALGAGIYF